jgi:TldD protein
MDGRDLAEQAVELGSSLGASYTEARFVGERTEGYSTRNGSLLSAGKQEREGLGIRVLVDGIFGFCSLDELTRSSVEEALESTVRTARMGRRRDAIVLSEEEVHQDSWRTGVETPFDDVDQQSKVGFLLGLDRSVDAVPGKTSLRRFDVKCLQWNKYLATSEGAMIDGYYSLFSLHVMFIAEDAGRSEQRHFSIGGTGGWEWAEGTEAEEKIVDDVKRTMDVVSKAKSVDLGKTDVVVGPEVAGIIAHENCGHPSEGDRILGREAAQAGESWYVDLKVGESRIGAEALTIVDDPTMERNAGYYLYDDEGVRARPRYLIKEGVLNELLLNREFGQRFGTGSTASARAIGYDREPIIRMANTYIAPGDHSAEELIEGVDRGVFMRNFTEWNIDDRRFQSKYVGSEAILIEKGELTDTYVRRPVLELTTAGLFGSVDACGKGFDADLATCGKSDPAQGAPVWTAGPSAVRLRGIRLGVGE